MNHKKIDFKEISFNPFVNPIEDSNDPDSHYFDEAYYDAKYFHVNEINTFSNELAQHENFSLKIKASLSLWKVEIKFRWLLYPITGE